MSRSATVNGFISALAATLFTLSAHAQDPGWEETRVFPVGHIDGKPARLLVRTSVADGEYYETRCGLSVNTPQRVAFSVCSPRSLFSMGTAPASAYRVTRTSSGFHLSYPCGNRFSPERQRCIDTWRLAARPARIQRRVVSPWSRAQTRLRSLLNQGRFAAAWQHAARTEHDPTGHGLASYPSATLLTLLRATIRPGRQRPLDTQRLLQLVQRSPVTVVSDNPQSPPDIWWCGSEPATSTMDAARCGDRRQLGISDSPHTRNVLRRAMRLLRTGGSEAATAAAAGLQAALSRDVSSPR